MTWHTQLNNVELSTMQLIQTPIVPTKMFVLSKTILISILRMLLHGLFKMAWNLNPDKYHAMVLGKTEDKFNFKLADIDIKTTEKTCLLGVFLDYELKFDDHISSICRKVSSQISALNRLKKILPLKTNLRYRFISRIYTAVF